jgi:hypothetical protein
MWIERNLFATCSSGLCNRLLMLAGSQRIAELTQRTFALYWPLNEALGCSFNELFTNRFEMVTEAELGLLLKTNFNVKVYNAWRTDGPMYRAIRRDGDPDVQIVVLKGWSDPRFEGETRSAEADAGLRRWLRELRPVPPIESAVNEFALPSATIGVHVRRGDDLAEFGRSRDEHFFRMMHGILERCPETTFFLATDVAATERRFQAELGSALLCAPKTWAPRDEVQGIREGLIDLLLLARTAGIIGTNYSSFSQTAARIGPGQLRVADETSAGVGLDETCAFFVRCLAQKSFTPVR